MNVTFAIVTICVFFVVIEVINWFEKDPHIIIRGMITLMRVCVVELAICTIVYLNNRPDYFRDSVISHQNELIGIQSDLIDSLANHLWNEHGCDLPIFDGDVLDNIHDEEAIIDSLYESKF